MSGGNGVDDLGMAAAMIVPPPPADDFTAEDMELWRAAMRSFELAMRYQARWYSTATEKTQIMRTITVPSSGTAGRGTKIADRNLHRVALNIEVDAGNHLVYYTLDGQFGTVSGNTPSQGQLIAAGQILTFGPEYCGTVHILNTAAVGSTATLEVVELFADDKVWST